MRSLSPLPALLPVLLLALFLPGTVRAAELNVLTAGAYKGVVQALAPGFEARTGHRLLISNDTAGGVARRLRDGQAADVVILTPAALEGLGALVRSGTERSLARVGIAVAVREGTSVPAIATPDDVRAAVVAARAPAWIDPAAGGSSGIYVDRLWEQWGIASLLRPRAVLVNGGLVADRLLDGTADLAFQQQSELTGIPGVVVLGPLPAAIQNYTTYAGAVTAGSAAAEAGAALLTYLSGPDAEPVLVRRGMLTPRSAP